MEVGIPAPSALGRATPSSPERDSNLDLPILGSLTQHETSALANYATKIVVSAPGHESRGPGFDSRIVPWVFFPKGELPQWSPEFAQGKIQDFRDGGGRDASALIEVVGKGFGTQKRNFDEIDRSSFDSFIKRNFDEIDRSGFDSFAKRNFDEIDRSGFGNFVKRIYWLMSRHPAEGR
uniref:Orcokinin n=2 Tax=Timema TaxID=61471 RepID=A0A7R8Z6R8_TIMDO|nr:unnamed protein product [Timema douglasi]